MAQFVSTTQFRLGNDEARFLPVIMSGPGIVVAHRSFPPEFPYLHLFRDVYQVMNTTGETLPHFLIPGGGTTILIPMGGQNNDEALFCGVLTKMYRILIPAHSSIYVVRLQDGCSECFTGEAAEELRDRTVPLRKYMQEADHLQQQMRNAQSSYECMSQLIRGLWEHPVESFQTVVAMQKSMDIIYKARGNVPVAEVAHMSGCTDRYLNKLYRKYMGISTKRFAEVIQLQYSLNHIRSFYPRSLLQVAVDYGYFDQAHMNRYYRKFLGCTANDMRAPEQRAKSVQDIPLFRMG